MAPMYGTLPSSHKPTGGTQRGSLVSPPHVHIPGPAPPVPADFRFEGHRMPQKGTQAKSRRPTSAPHKPEKHWHNPPPAAFNWPAGRVASESPVNHPHASHQHHQHHPTLGAVATRFASPPAGHSPSGPVSGGQLPPGSYPMVGSVGAPHHQMVMGPAGYGGRPGSLEVPQPLKMADVMGEGPDRQQRFSSPVGPSLVSSRPPNYYQHHQHPSSTLRSSPLSSSSQHASLSSPIGSFPGDMDHDRPVSFHGAPGDRYSSPSPSQRSYSTLDRLTPTFNEDLYTSRLARNSPRGRPFLEEEGRQTAFTKRDKVIERIRIPSSTSVNTKSGSVEIVSGRSSPGSPMFPLDHRGSLKYKCCPSSDEYIYRRKTPSHHETRDITFEKSSKPVGFKIQRGPSGGIFVSSVNDNSMAAQAGLVIGDQLLEVCGINMRNANYDHATTVLRQCGDNLTMKVQYNPEKYNEHQDASSSTSINSSLATSPTHSSQNNGDKSTKHGRGQGFGEVPTDGRRFLTLKKSNPNMIGPGFSFIGGNAVGIFVHEVYPDCFVGGTVLLQRGDHILEFNSVDFRAVTAEKAMVELNRPCATMTLCVFLNFAKYNKIQQLPCDSFYIRANFERASETEEELDFHRDDVMFVENSLYKNQLGTWFAWLVNEQGVKLKGGVIPSRIRLEDEMVLRRTHSESWSLHESDDLKGSRRGSASARRSFFRRKRHHRNNSKDSHEFGSLSDASLSSDSVPILDDSILGYTQVEKIELKTTRPVVLLAPLAEALIRKLVAESPDKYSYCQPAPMRASPATMEQSLAEGVLIDYWKEEEVYQCVRAAAVKDICDREVHCLLSVSPAAIERMHQSKVYPITIFVRHKSSKQIRDIRDPQFHKERASNKVAKELLEQFHKVEVEYQHLFSAIIQGGNLAEMCRHIQTVIATEQKKAIWVTSHVV
ncbi:disks large homolog 5 [Aplysia californica]|uniref:Disks large homolog 5 n=1 Tax=Aplysia californica TaxID=6500 RepID=A0ABM1A8L9_APLCA|nr:disks large homolog 5 [Aplysia californica]